MTLAKIRRLLAVAPLLLALGDSAMALPVSTLADAGVAPELARGGFHGGHGGGFHGGHGGGFHGGHGGGYHGGGYHGGHYHGGYHGGHYHGGRYVYRGGRNVYVGGWNRPYAWRPGGAIAAGAAIGFVTAATAAAVASTAAPAPGLCWYYTNAARTAGFWDNCP